MKYFFLFSILLLSSCVKSNIEINQTNKSVPSAPLNLTGTLIQPNQIELKWSDVSNDEEGFKIERKTSQGNFTLVTTLPSNTFSYIDKDINFSTTYTYRVFSYNKNGNSTYSNELSIATEDIEVGQLKLGLIAYFPFTGNAIDSSNNGNNGTVNGATLTNDRFNKNSNAYLFSNSLDHSISGTFKTSLNEIFTISFWVKRNNNLNTGSSEQNDKEWIFSSGNSSEGGATNIGLSNNSSELRYGPWGLDGAASGYNLNNTWQHIVQTYSNGEFQLFVNGKFIKSIKSIVKITNGSFSIGCQLSPFTKQGFEGVIDDIRIHNRILTQKEIEYLATH
jgi:hypothetical protein